MGRTARWTLGLAAFALAVRLAVLVLTLAAAPVGADEVAALHDGTEYLQRAAAVGSPAAASRVWPQARRLSPGYPLLIYAASWLLPPPAAALALSMLAAATATALVYRLGASPWAAALFAVLTPSWVAFSSTAMSEGPFLAVALLGLVAWRRGRGVAAGLLFGAASLVRPVGLVLFCALWLHGRWGRSGDDGEAVEQASLRSLAACALAPAAWTAWGMVFGAGARTSAAIYLRFDLAPPLSSVVSALAAPWADPLKLLQNLFVLALTGAAAWLLWRRRCDPAAAAEERRRASGWLVWLLSQAAFYLLLPSAWVWECLGRFLVTGLPAVAVAADLAPLRRQRAVRAWLLAAFTVVSVAIGVYWNLRALGEL